MLFVKENLVNNNYCWNDCAGGSMFTGNPSRRSFDRSNGNQVLYMINCFATSIGTMTLVNGQKLEELITNQLPEEVKSEMSVFNWLMEVYLYYWD